VHGGSPRLSHHNGAVTYRERLRPSPLLIVMCVLLIPAVILVFAPIDLLTGIIAGVVLYVIVLVVLIGSAPTVGIGPEGLRAGRALLPLEYVGHAEALDGADAFAARGTGLDARAFAYFRGNISGLVRVANTDTTDPAPYWVISTRQPHAFAEAIRSATGCPD